MELAQDRDRWWALVGMVRNLRVLKMRGVSWLAAEPVSFSRRTLLHGVSKMYEPKHHIPFSAWLVLWKGCMHFKRYHPLNTSLFGIKTSELCESSCGWPWSFIVMILEWPIISKDSENKSNSSGTSWSYTFWLNNNNSQQDFGNVNENVSLQGFHIL
jgi:hypothetical protein